MKEISTLTPLHSVSLSHDTSYIYRRRHGAAPKVSTLIKLRQLARAAFATPQSLPLVVLN